MPTTRGFGPVGPPQPRIPKTVITPIIAILIFMRLTVSVTNEVSSLEFEGNDLTCSTWNTVLCVKRKGDGKRTDG